MEIVLVIHSILSLYQQCIITMDIWNNYHWLDTINVFINIYDKSCWIGIYNKDIILNVNINGLILNATFDFDGNNKDNQMTLNIKDIIYTTLCKSICDLKY